MSGDERARGEGKREARERDPRRNEDLRAGETVHAVAKLRAKALLAATSWLSPNCSRALRCRGLFTPMKALQERPLAEWR